MNAFVIGGSGFIGSRLVSRLLGGGRSGVYIYDKNMSHQFPKITIIGDIRSQINCNELNLEGAVLFNLAAEHRDDVSPLSLYRDVNVGGAENVCDFARESGVSKIIFTSSVAVYGFAPINTDESGLISPFNEYGKTKWEAEEIYKKWQAEMPSERTLVIIRPTVVFGEGNRGNVFNLLRKISSKSFIMIGNGLNRKSIAYVENVAAFLEYSMTFNPGIHIFNYVDKPDMTMNLLIQNVRHLLGKSQKINFRLPFNIALIIAFGFDIVASLTGKKFAISAIRVKKFCSNSLYESAVDETGFIAPIPILTALERVVRFEFLEVHEGE